jgi:hypothetical protein
MNILYSDLRVKKLGLERITSFYNFSDWEFELFLWWWKGQTPYLREKNISF